MGYGVTFGLTATHSKMTVILPQTGNFETYVILWLLTITWMSDDLSNVLMVSVEADASVADITSSPLY